jgi:hypothetical protein
MLLLCIYIELPGILILQFKTLISKASIIIGAIYFIRLRLVIII